ncbi:hypothetical protein HZA97_01050 [Candidatus Woesearchaeota archaeon]|nr:hypothetical protein [Candidatus Woesearchaeota archaeon]
MKQNILGDKKKSSFDDNLADVVNKIFDSKPDKVVSENDMFISGKEYSLKGLKVCWKPEEGGALKNQKEWGDYWDKIGDGRVMMSMADLYKIMTRTQEYFITHSGYGGELARDFKKQLREDFSAGLVVDSCLDYGENKYREYVDAEIVHNCVIQESMYLRSRRIAILENYLSTSLSELCESNLGRMFLREFLDTMDGTNTIIESFEKISGVKKENIVFRVFHFPLNNSTQISLPSKLAQIFVKELNDSLYIDCTYSPNSAIKGRSRGVRYE